MNYNERFSFGCSLFYDFIIWIFMYVLYVIKFTINPRKRNELNLLYVDPHLQWTELFDLIAPMHLFHLIDIVKWVYYQKRLYLVWTLHLYTIFIYTGCQEFKCYAGKPVLLGPRRKNFVLLFFGNTFEFWILDHPVYTYLYIHLNESVGYVVFVNLCHLTVMFLSTKINDSNESLPFAKEYLM